MDTVVFTATYADIPAHLPVPGTFRELLRERFVLAHEVLGKITESTGALCLDVTAAAEWSRPDMWSEDGLHPTPRGHQWFAESIADLLERATGTPCRPRC
ncbi:SGNH/GDSL hydrolase family protein [Streptomyces antimycoticus]|uniref:hypothetical protein n=1 Tax=Streptomyces antimycoticus TaxID=68175 RepID=UPI001375331E|nr:hypothetical protein [Streptomyces antimycoticus]WJE02498.1 hypothetical protein QR300_36070 [Streptomyces antimycoticus]